ncbi:hypothetical protein LPJGGPFB_05225 [Ensifer adhaerens]|uniref:Uncharacterized protein n=1 Tax=Ensifer adhaerens TaxID=106592 RepID=A0ACC5T5E5_ENSAD|nr:hypothetical protein [Ensifer adhaerens]MBP1876320.1 hypothetical protein [Ensifer adhaerens]NRP21966.1 hypothetical protein [Ensifer adhaerens]
MQLGMSESARFSSAEEARFRVGYPNSRPRKSRIIALDAASFEVLVELAGREWSDAHFLGFVETKPASETLHMLPVDAVLKGLDGSHVNLADEVADADVIVMVATAGATAEVAEVIGNACFVRNKLPTGLVLSAPEVSYEMLSRTLINMRPFAAMLVISNGVEYVSEMLSALRV